ncbi:MAG: hypothetical protein IT308_08020 [Anaerolineaceae bacterium]|nr:hypothetical protein [Anaerolineaceae bacterium]
MKENDEIRWDIVVPIFKNRVILQELGIALGIPFGMLLLVLALTTGGKFFASSTVVFAAGFFAVFMVVSFLFVLLVMGHYPVNFVMDSRGITYSPQKRQENRNRLINTLTIVFGLLSGKPSIAGAGFLANARQKMYLPWGKVKKLKTYPRSHTIVLYGQMAEKMGVFCSPDSYSDILTYITAHIK